ncbi:hypothetical protein LCGC14_3079260 [marine sediment metagenome]|uniref:Cytochrome c domain-containing protein n=1 Tax=marine sediment metagenome TaxID=412755 RepID=A0A0F8YLD9_9ZZZZ
MSIMQRFNFLDENQLTALITYTQSQGGKLAALRYAATNTGNWLMRLNSAMVKLDDPQAPYATLINQLQQTSELRPNGKESDKSPSGLTWEKVWHMNSFARSYWLTENPLEVNDENLMRGKATFSQRCVGCHGVKGDGKGPAADKLAVKPFDFTKASNSSDAGTSSGQMYHRILTAGPGTSMENFGTRLSVADIWRTVLFLRTIPKGGLEETLPTKAMYQAWSPPQEMLNYLEENPLTEMYSARAQADDPFMQAARWIAPGMADDDLVYVGGKLPLTLERLAAVIRYNYDAAV